MSEVEKDNKLDYIKLFRNICLLILVFTVVYVLLVNFISPEGNRNETRGTFGDLFGGLNAIFSGFAFAGVIITILMQMKELDLTRKEMRKSVEAQDKSQSALNLQLKNMQSNSRIESVKNIIETYSERDELDKKEVAKLILEKLVEDVFYDKEFLQYVKPKIIFSSNPILRGQRNFKSQFGGYEKYDSSKSNQIIIECENRGASFIINSTSTPDSEIKVNFTQILIKNSGGQITTSYPSLKNGNLIERNSKFQVLINNFKDQKHLRIFIQIEGDFVKHKYELILNIERSEANIQVESEFFTQINSDDNI